MGLDYLGMSFQEREKAQQGVSPAAIFGLSFLFVFLILAALYGTLEPPLERSARHSDRGPWAPCRTLVTR